MFLEMRNSGEKNIIEKNKSEKESNARSKQLLNTKRVNSGGKKVKKWGKKQRKVFSSYYHHTNITQCNKVKVKYLMGH